MIKILKPIRQEKFLLKRLALKENPIFSNIDIHFTDDSDNSKSPYISLIIGPNGTGKSNLLRIIIDLFRQISDYNKEGKSSYVTGAFYLEYSIGNDHFIYGNFDPESSLNLILLTPKKQRVLFAKKNNDSIDFKDLGLPTNLLACSIMLTDKFYFSKNNKTYSFYNYLGVRTSSNQSGTLSYIRKSIDLLIRSTFENKEIFLKKFSKILDVLNYDKRITIRYQLSYKDKFFSGNLTNELFIDIFINWKKHFKTRKTPPYGYKNFISLNKNFPSTITKVVELLNRLKKENYLRKIENSQTEYLTFELYDETLNKEDYVIINILNSLDILRTPSITFYKNKVALGYKQSSSGEQHILTMLIGIISKIEQGGLILIDEPEISLHPNWQMRYVNDFIVELFKEYSSCHFIIATHSHFLASDIRAESSKIVGLKRGEEKIENIDFGDIDTFGWSAEEILFRIFNVKSTRNHYLEVELRELLFKISQNSKDFNRINELLINLKKLNISESDPLNLIINQAENYLNK